MRRVSPKVFLIGRSAIIPKGAADYLSHIGTKWTLPEGSTDGDTLVEFMGRLCYRSWEPGLNANVKKVRADQREYLENILRSKHGSVLEHPVLHLVFADVSRVFTHELVRHRAGMAFSQESLRFVRLTDLGLWLPPEIEAHPDLVRLFESTFETLEGLQVKMAETLKLDDLPFAEKKKYTSAMRRIAPIGLATTIGVTVNVRAARHILTMRTAKGAEAEIRLVLDLLAEIFLREWPGLFQDFERLGEGEWVPKYEKV